MKKIILTLATVACMTLPMQAQAFDITGIVTNAVKSAVTDVVKETTTEVTKTAAKTVVKETGIVGADKYVGMAVDNAGSVKNLNASTKMLNADGAAGVVAKANALAVTADNLRRVEPSSGVSTNKVNTNKDTIQKMEPGRPSVPVIQKGNPVSGFLKGMFNSQ